MANLIKVARFVLLVKKMSETNTKKIPQKTWDQLEDFMGNKLASDPSLYEEQLHEIIIEFMGCMTNNKLFADIARAAIECLETSIECLEE